MYDNYGKYNHLSTKLPDTFSIPSSDSDVLPPAMAQQAPDRNSAFQFGIIPPLSSNGLKMREFTNGVSVNMLLGISKNERYLTVSGAGSIVSGQADGLQLSGLFNWTGGGSGLMASSCFNVTRGTFTGLQIAGLVNVADKVRGVQLQRHAAGVCHGHFVRACPPCHPDKHPDAGGERPQAQHQHRVIPAEDTDRNQR